MIATAAVAVGSLGVLSSCDSWVDYVDQAKITEYFIEDDDGSLLYRASSDDDWSATGYYLDTANFLDMGIGLVTVSQYVDGDTTYFKVPDNRTVRARYSNINTPESTASVQKWGKSASIFTQTQLESATSVILTNPTMDPRVPSTDSNNRPLCLVWYATVENPTLDDYRCLNLEIVQEGYSSVSGMESYYPYYDIFIAAQTQAQEYGLHIHSSSSTVDPNYYEGEATDMTVFEFNQNPEKYEGKTVHITSAIVSHYLGVSDIWVESLVPAGTEYTDSDGNEKVTTEDEIYGIYLFGGYSGSLTPLYTVGNEVSFTGTVSEYNGEYQITGLSYTRFNPSDDDVQILSTGNAVPSESRVMTAGEALAEGAVNTATFVTVSSVFTCYGGYGGSNEIDSSTGTYYDNDAFTLFVTADDGTECRIYLPDGCSFRDGSTLVRSYTYFVGRQFTIRGLVETYNGYTNFEVPGKDLLTFVDEDDDDDETTESEDTDATEDEEIDGEDA